MLFINDDYHNKLIAINPNIPLNKKEKSLILTFLDKRINDWINKNGNTIFYLDDIVGTTYQDWHGTPIIHLWQYHYAFHKKENPNGRHKVIAELTTQSTLNDLTQLLKYTLIISNHAFLYNDEWLKSYQWVKILDL